METHDCNAPRALRGLARGLADVHDGMKARGEDPEDAHQVRFADAAEHLDSALDRIDSAIRTLEDEDEPDPTVPAGCTGHLEPVPPHGRLMLAHDGPTCPVHEHTDEDSSELTRQQLADVHRGPIPPVDDRTPDNDTGDEHDPPDSPAARLEYLRGELRAERISWGELAELQGLAGHIAPDDVELLEAAGVPETRAPDDDTAGTPDHNRRADEQLDRIGERVHAAEPIIVTLDAMEPATLLDPAAAAGIAVTVHRSGLAVTLDGPRASVYELIVEQWGDETQASELTGYYPPKDDGPHNIRGALLEASDACETLADLDEGEHTDPDRLRRIAGMLRVEAGE